MVPTVPLSPPSVKKKTAHLLICREDLRQNWCCASSSSHQQLLFDAQHMKHVPQVFSCKWISGGIGACGEEMLLGSLWSEDLEPAPFGVDAVSLALWKFSFSLPAPVNLGVGAVWKFSLSSSRAASSCFPSSYTVILMSAMKLLYVPVFLLLFLYKFMTSSEERV